MLKEIKQRQSIRKYTKQEIEESVLLELLHAGMRAPTARNTQDWKFYVITGEKNLETVSNLTPYSKMIKDAKAAIVVATDLSFALNEIYGYVDASAAIQNILIEAVHQNLGACWCGIGPVEERIEAYQKYLDLPASIIPVGVISLGYPDEEKPLQERFDLDKVRFIR